MRAPEMKNMLHIANTSGFKRGESSCLAPGGEGDEALP